MKKTLALALAAVMSLGLLAGCGGGGSPAVSGSSTPAASSQPGGSAPAAPSDLKVAVFYYNYADAYIATVRNAMDKELDALGVSYQNYDAQTNQAEQTNQINTAITDGYNLLVINIVENAAPDAAQKAVDAAKEKGIPVIFFNRDFDKSVVQSYDKSAFVGTDAPEAGHMQGKAVGDYVLANYDKVDLNGDGKISYVMFKGQEGNAEAEARTEFGVADANAVLTAAGKPELEFYDASNAKKYLVDTAGAWSAAEATNYMNTILAEYNDGNKNMVELVIANNDSMAEGAISALQSVGYNVEGGDKVIPVFGVDAMDSAVEKIDAGIMTGSIKQDAEGMASTIATLVKNVKEGADLMANTDQFNVDSDAAKIRVPYALYSK